MISIRKRLLVAVFGVLMFFAVVVAVLTYISAHEEVTEIFDENMKQIAIAISAHENQGPVYESSDKTELKGEEEFLVQIWREQDLEYTSHKNIRFPLQDKDGYLNTDFKGETWRYYKYKKGNEVVQVAQSLDERNETILEIVYKFIVPIFLQLPIMLGLVYFMIGRGLQPLSAISTKVKELKKLKNMSPMSAEATVIRNYLDWVLSIPWNNPSTVSKNINKARNILEADHYGLDKVKDRILEYLAVQKRIERIRGPILCLVGPPGVGKTSLGKSIASATGRSFVRMSLGGIRDEAEIRGHRKTYIGSMPGRFIQVMKKSKTSNPLILLDEIDKLGSDWRGDPSSALLEVLDPEQNSKFNDHYLELDYDLSNVMFVCTGNTLNIPAALLDRMEIIRIPGYTEKEKYQIAKKYLAPKQIKNHGLKNKEIVFSASTLNQIIRYYTREAGVRNLEKEIAKVCRKAVKILETSSLTKISLDKKKIEKYLGVEKFKNSEIEKKNLVGITNGLAWTEVGGEILSIEVLLSIGKGKLTITGKLGDVMKESIQAASSYVRSQSLNLGINPIDFDKYDIHVHVPEGATPKDGPSAGIAIFNSLVSSLTGNKVKRNVALTGEITLRGRVLPIGGLKEKLYAALRAGIKTVLIPEDNKKDLSEIDKDVLKNLTIIPISEAKSILEYTLAKPIVALNLSESEIIKSQKSVISSTNIEESITH